MAARFDDHMFAPEAPGHADFLIPFVCVGPISRSDYARFARGVLPRVRWAGRIHLSIKWRIVRAFTGARAS